MLSRRRITKCGDKHGYSPQQCYVLIDSHGERSGPYPCIDYDVLDRVLKGKENLNLQIKMWVDTTVEDPIALLPSEVKKMTFDYPEWVYKSYINKLQKRYIDKIGWVPTFINRNIMS